MTIFEYCSKGRVWFILQALELGRDSYLYNQLNYYEQELKHIPLLTNELSLSHGHQGRKDVRIT